MPSRWQCLFIVVFGLAIAGWLYVRELEPNFREHDPPQYVIELTAETQVVHPKVVWKVFQNDQEEESYLAKTWMDHNEDDDSFTLYASVKPAPLQSERIKADLLIQDLASSYRVSREGTLREFNVWGELAPPRWARWASGVANLKSSMEFQLNASTIDGPRMIAQVRFPQFSGLFPELEK